MEPSGSTIKVDAVTERVSAADARDRLAELMNRARFGGERFIITRNGEDVALLVGAPQPATVAA